MARTPTVVVFGSTGTLGGSIVKALVEDGNFHISGVTRDPEQPKAKELASKGVQLVKADINDVQSIREAVRGAHAVFAVTNYCNRHLIPVMLVSTYVSGSIWVTPSRETEIGKSIADAAKEAGVQHFIWSTMPDTDEESNGKWPCRMFSDKAKVDQYIKELGFKYYTYMAPASFFSNYEPPLSFATKEDDGVYSFKMALRATDYLPTFDEKVDFGKPVPSILKNPEKWGQGQRINFAGTYASYQEYVDTFKRVTGKEARLVEIPLDDVAKRSKELAEMFGWFQEFGYYGRKADVHTAAQLVPHLTTWEEYLKKTAHLWT